MLMEECQVFFVLLIFVLLCGALHMLGKHSTTDLYPQPESQIVFLWVTNKFYQVGRFANLEFFQIGKYGISE